MVSKNVKGSWEKWADLVNDTVYLQGQIWCTVFVKYSYVIQEIE